MATDLLPEFQKYLLSRQLVPEENVSFYAWWVSRFLAFSNTREGLPGQLLVERFIEHLRQKKAIADWQLRQAQEAIRLYLDHFPEGKREGPPAVNTVSGSLSQKEAILKARQAIRLKHYSYKTERSYVDWIRRFYEYLQNVLKRDLVRQPLASGDVQEYLSHLAIKQKVSSST